LKASAIVVSKSWFAVFIVDAVVYAGFTPRRRDARRLLRHAAILAKRHTYCYYSAYAAGYAMRTLRHVIITPRSFRLFTPTLVAICLVINRLVAVTIGLVAWFHAIGFRRH